MGTVHRSPVRTEVVPADGACVVRLAGELDADDAPGVRSLLAEQVLEGSGSLVLDLSELVFVDSAGLAALVAAHKGTRAAGTCLVLAGVSPQVAKVLAISGLDGVLTVAPSVPEALALVAARTTRSA